MTSDELNLGETVVYEIWYSNLPAYHPRIINVFTRAESARKWLSENNFSGEVEVVRIAMMRQRAEL